MCSARGFKLHASEALVFGVLSHLEPMCDLKILCTRYLYYISAASRSVVFSPLTLLRLFVLELWCGEEN